MSEQVDVWVRNWRRGNLTILNGKSNENEFDLRGQDHESVDVFFWIIIFAGAVGLNGGSKEKD